MKNVLSPVISSLVNEGVFGNVKFVDLKSENDKDIGPQYGSTLTFLKLLVENGSEEVTLPILVKTILTQRTMDSTIQFMMESLMYKEVLPTLTFEQVCYPKMYYSNASLENPEKNVLIFENVKYKHYQNSKIKIFLDFEHISLALKTIAMFHSSSFILKHENKSKFLELTEKMKEFSFDPKRYAAYDLPMMAAYERGVRAFEKENGPDEVLEDFLRAMKHAAILRNQLSMPEKPFDVICHGDFCNNNIMYKYDESGSPTDLILYDFQSSRYGNVAAEIAFFLYMHTDSDCREKYWDSFLMIYWKSLREYVPNHIPLPSYEDFLEYFGTKAVLGYVIGGYFLPVVMDPNIGFWAHLPMEEQIALLKNAAGDEGEKVIADIVSHLYKNKYIHQFLEFIKTKD